MTLFKLKLFGILITLGILGVFSLLFSQLPIDHLPKEITEKFGSGILKLVLLINPIILVVLSVTIGTLLYDKVGLRVPLIEKILGKKFVKENSIRIVIKYGILFGISAGGIIFFISNIFSPFLPKELIENNSLHIITRILYGGITEEIMIRFGLMTLFIWVLSRIIGKTTPIIYWISILLSAGIFALGHIPVLLTVIPEPDIITYLYIIVANSVGGLFFGYAYSRPDLGLESACIAHIFSHITLIIIGFLL